YARRTAPGPPLFPYTTLFRSHEVVTGLKERGIHTPVLLRFNDVLAHRLREIRKAFDDSMAEQAYRGGYSCVYPIKVNQQRHVCRSEEHTSELQSLRHLVCRLL